MQERNETRLTQKPLRFNSFPRVKQ